MQRFVVVVLAALASVADVHAQGRTVNVGDAVINYEITGPKCRTNTCFAFCILQFAFCIWSARQPLHSARVISPNRNPRAVPQHDRLVIAVANDFTHVFRVHDGRPVNAHEA